MGLLYRLSKPEQAIAVEGSLPITSRYTAGIAGETFFREIMENGKLLGSYCPECDLVYLPPRLYCERCMAQLDEWVDVPNTGTIHTFTAVHLDLARQRPRQYVGIIGRRGLGEFNPLFHASLE